MDCNSQMEIDLLYISQNSKEKELKIMLIIILTSAVGDCIRMYHKHSKPYKVYLIYKHTSHNTSFITSRTHTRSEEIRSKWITVSEYSNKKEMICLNVCKFNNLDYPTTVLIVCCKNWCATISTKKIWCSFRMLKTDLGISIHLHFVVFKCKFKSS